MRPFGAGLEPGERRFLEEAVARGLMTEAAVEQILALRGTEEDGSLQPISQLLLLERAIAVPDYLALKRSLAEGDARSAPPRQAAFGPCHVVREIARTQLTAVFECEDPKRRRVAVKALLSLTDAAAAKRKRLETEVRALARLSHPGIVRVHGAANENGLPYFVMDLVQGRTLAEIVRERGPADPIDAATAIAKAADAIAHAHRRGVLHRDLKPANLIIPGALHEAQPVIVGFGAAKMLGFEPRVTRPGELVAAPSYIAPELVRSELGPAGPGTDIYALGTILFELVTGKRPFEAPSVSELLAKIVDEPAPLLDRLVPDAPPALTEAVARALSKRPADRHANAADFAAELREAARESGKLLGGPRPPTVREPPSPPPARERSERQRRRKRTSPWQARLVAAVAILLVQAPLLAGLAWQTIRAARIERRSKDLEGRAAAAVDAAASWTRTRERAEELAARSALEEAIALLGSAALARGPRGSEPLVLRARLLVLDGRDEEARSDATRALLLLDERSRKDAGPLRARALVERARCALDGGDPGAVRDLEAALSQDDALASEVLALRAWALALAGKPAEARKDLERAERAPRGTRAIAEAAILVRERAVDRALGVLSAAREADPDDALVQAARGGLLLEARRFREASADLEPLSDRTPRSGPNALLAARALMGDERWLRALKLHARARDLGARDAALDGQLDVVKGLRRPVGPEEVAARASYLVEQGGAEEALKLLDAQNGRERSVALDRARFEALEVTHSHEATRLAPQLAAVEGPARFERALAKAFVAARDLEGAERAATRAIDEDPRDPESFLLRARVRRRAASFAASAPAFEALLADAERAIALGTTEPGDAHLLVADALAALGRSRDAIAACERAARAGTGHPDLLAEIDRLARVAGGPPESTEARTPLSEAERARIEASEIGDDEGWEPLGTGHTRFAFGREHLYGRSGVAVGGEGGLGAGYPSAPWRKTLAEWTGRTPKWRETFAVGKGFAFELAVRTEGGRILLGVRLQDAAGNERRLGSLVAVRADGVFRTQHVPLSGDASWKPVGPEGAFDAARVARVEIRFEGEPRKAFLAWLDGLRPD